MGDDFIIFIKKTFRKSADRSFSKKGLLIDWPVMKGGAKLEQKTVRKGTHRESPLAKNGCFVKQTIRFEVPIIEREKACKAAGESKVFFEKGRAKKSVETEICLHSQNHESKPLFLGRPQLILRAR